ncbi:excalibur calcium-binding domain-containing protein [Kribbella sp. NPDC002412]
MRQFNTPPGWPDPPNARWRPPKRWGPAPSWPPAPDGWRFWVDEEGRPVRGPIGRYGGPSVVKLGSAALVVLALIGLVLFNPFTGGGDDSTPTAAPTAEVESSAAPESMPTAPGTETPTTAHPTPKAATTEPTAEPTPTPSAPSDTPTEPEPSTPKTTPTPSKTPTTTNVTVVYRNCAEVRAAGKAPLHRGDPGYSEELDNNGDGTACDRGNS